MTAMEHLIAHLQRNEGFRALVYDDHNGKPIGPGSVVIGNPTIGYGWALNKLPMSQAQAMVHLRDAVQEVIFNLQMRIPWMKDLDEVRQVALYEMAYNNGVDGLLGFHQMLEALRRHKYALAATEALDSKWAREDVAPARSQAISHMLEVGEWPTASGEKDCV